MKRNALFIAVLAALSLSAYAGEQQQGSSSDQGSQSQAAAGGGMHAGMSMSGMHDEDTIRQVQEKLSAEGHDAGPADGRMGPKTKAALKKYQEAKGINASGELDDETLSALGIEKSAGAGSSSGASSSSGSTQQPTEEKKAD